MLEEYDFSKGIQGKYANKYAEGTNVVVIEPDVAKFFPDHDSVNQALRSIAEIIKRRKKSPSNHRIQYRISLLLKSSLYLNPFRPGGFCPFALLPSALLVQ